MKENTPSEVPLLDIVPYRPFEFSYVLDKPATAQNRYQSTLSHPQAIQVGITAMEMGVALNRGSKVKSTSHTLQKQQHLPLS